MKKLLYCLSAALLVAVIAICVLASKNSSLNEQLTAEKAAGEKIAAQLTDAEQNAAKAAEDAAAQVKAAQDEAAAQVQAAQDEAAAQIEAVRAEAEKAAETAAAEMAEKLQAAQDEAEQAKAAVAELEKAKQDAENEVAKLRTVLTDTAEELKKSLGSAVKAEAALEDVKETVEEKAETAAEEVKEAVEEKAEAVSEEVKETVEEKAEAAAEEVKEAVTDAVETVETTVEEAVQAPAAVMDHAAYAAAALESEVSVETFVQAKQGWWDNKATIYAQSPDGAYFIYNMPISQEDYDKLVPGTKIAVKGYKAEWAGEVEITDATFEILEGDAFIAEPADVTALLGTDELIAHQNELVAFKGMTVEAYDESGAAFAYKDAVGKTDDLYFKVSKDGQTYEFCVEFYLCGKDTDVYKAVEALKVGDVVDLEGFLYWYNGANPHITAVKAAD